MMVSLCIVYCRNDTTRTAETVATAVWDEIAKCTGLYDIPDVPEAPTWDTHLANAQSMRDFLDRECRRSVCGVCSMMRRGQDVKLHDIASIPNLHLLDSTLPKTAAHPRDGLTTFAYTDPASSKNVVYCLQPHACSDSDDGKVNVSVCDSCHHHLTKGRVPPESLVCFDTGKQLSRYTLLLTDVNAR